jgi:hypothetical protein
LLTGYNSANSNTNTALGLYPGTQKETFYPATQMTAAGQGLQMEPYGNVAEYLSWLAPSLSATSWPSFARSPIRRTRSGRCLSCRATAPICRRSNLSACTSATAAWGTLVTDEAARCWAFGWRPYSETLMASLLGYPEHKGAACAAAGRWRFLYRARIVQARDADGNVITEALTSPLASRRHQAGAGGARSRRRDESGSGDRPARCAAAARAAGRMTAFTIVLLTFMAGTASADAEQTIRCPVWPCVERVIAYAHHSTRLARLRVYRGDPGNLGNGATVSRPIIDEWLS